MENDLMKVIPVVNHRGILLEKMIGGFRIFGKVVKTMEEVDEVIDQTCSILNESIWRVENREDGVMECQNSVVEPLQPQEGAKNDREGIS